MPAGILTKILTENADLFADFLHPAFNECVKTRKFPSCLKQADITLYLKKCFLRNVSEIFEKH